MKESQGEQTMAYCKDDLTREKLEEMGITDVYWDEDNQDWWINRYWYKTSPKGEYRHIKVGICRSVRKHKYVPDKCYPIVNFNYKGKMMSYSLSKFLYAWFKGPVPAGYVVDHRNNNPFDNSLDNLQLLTIAENNRKRFEDHSDCKCFNQFYNTNTEK